jgi:DNA-directed RNA polymerase subunit RPC12/RpoP
MLQCKKCNTRLFENNAYKEHGDLVIPCPYCQAKNLITPVLINKVPVSMFEVVGYRE